MYDAASGGSSLANPLTTDSVNGEIEFWLDEPRRVDLKITKAGYTTRTVTVDVSDSGDEEASTDVARTFTADQQFTNLYVGVNSGDTNQEPYFSTEFNAGVGATNGVVNLQPRGGTKHTGLAILPSGSPSSVRSQVICYSVTGNNYERFGFNAKDDSGVIDFSVAGTGTLRPIVLAMQSTSALVIRTDSHVVVGDGKRFGVGTGQGSGDNPPQCDLHVRTTSGNPELRIEGTSAPKLSFHIGDATERAYLTYDNGRTALILDSDSLIEFRPNNTLGLTINTDGKLRFIAGNEQTTVGAAGGADALPATPTKYLKFIDSAGTTLVVPAYASA